MFASALSKNQIVAFILGVVFCFFFFMVGEELVLANLPSWLTPFLDYLSVQNHFESIARGVLDSRDVIFYLSLIAAFLYFNRLVLARRR
jgi:ABC-2 type transport system permease protein